MIVHTNKQTYVDYNFIGDTHNISIFGFKKELSQSCRVNGWP